MREGMQISVSLYAIGSHNLSSTKQIVDTAAERRREQKGVRRQEAGGWQEGGVSSKHSAKFPSGNSTANPSHPNRCCSLLKSYSPFERAEIMLILSRIPGLGHI